MVKPDLIDATILSSNVVEIIEKLTFLVYS